MDSMSASPVNTSSTTTTNNNTNNSEKPIDISEKEWLSDLQEIKVPRTYLNRIVMNYLITEGYKEAAEKFHIESGVEPNDKMDSLEDRILIKDFILKGDILAAIDNINMLYPELLDQEKKLFFHLLQQHTIELIRENKIEEALNYAQNNLADCAEDDIKVLPEIEATLALLAFNDPSSSPYGKLLLHSQRQKVASEVNSAILNHLDENSQPILSAILRFICWGQEELDQKKVQYPKIVDFSNANLEK